MQKKHTGKLLVFLQAICVVPLFLFGIVLMMLTYMQLTKSMTAEIETELKNAAYSIEALLDAAYPGDYTLVGTTSYQLMKGEQDITSAYDLLDQYKKATGLDVTVFYQDTRILTTLQNTSGERIVGTAAPETVMREVFAEETPHFYKSIFIYFNEYYSYYMPLRNADGSVAGILFVGKAAKAVDSAIQSYVYPLAIAVVLIILIIALCLFWYTRNFDQVLNNIRSFLNEVSKGNLNATLDSSVLKRNDEFGEIGRNIASMQTNLRRFIEQDTLTELFNRRYGDRKLKQIVQKATSQNAPFSVAIGDIDFFKKVNDTYGHDCGDIVLKQVAAVLREHMRSEGFVARWGGEEFLMVFDHSSMTEAKEALEKTLDHIRSLEIPYRDTIVRVTMTFGISEGNTSDINQLLKTADDKLYTGKTGGRNRVII